MLAYMIASTLSCKHLLHAYTSSTTLNKYHATASVGMKNTLRISPRLHPDDQSRNCFSWSRGSMLAAPTSQRPRLRPMCVDDWLLGIITVVGENWMGKLSGGVAASLELCLMYLGIALKVEYPRGRVVAFARDFCSPPSPLPLHRRVH